MLRKSNILIELKSRNKVKNAGVCDEPSSVPQLELTGAGFLPWKGSFETLKKDSTFKTILQSHDYVVARPSTHCQPSNRKGNSLQVDCLRGYSIDAYDCTSPE